MQMQWSITTPNSPYARSCQYLLILLTGHYPAVTTKGILVQIKWIAHVLEVVHTTNLR